jgi:hypothetical protein
MISTAFILNSLKWIVLMFFDSKKNYKKKIRIMHIVRTFYPSNNFQSQTLALSPTSKLLNSFKSLSSSVKSNTLIFS